MRECLSGPVIQPGDAPRPYPWTEKRYNEHLNNGIPVRAMAQHQFATADAARRPGLAGMGEYRQSHAPTPTIQDYIIPARRAVRAR